MYWGTCKEKGLRNNNGNQTVSISSISLCISTCHFTRRRSAHPRGASSPTITPPSPTAAVTTRPIPQQLKCPSPSAVVPGDGNTDWDLSGNWKFPDGQFGIPQCPSKNRPRQGPPTMLAGGPRSQSTRACDAKRKGEPFCSCRRANCYRKFLETSFYFRKFHVEISVVF